MTLGEAIQKLSAMPPSQVMRPGFGKPSSYRGVYAEVAFYPVESSTVAEMLAHAKSAIGPVFVGYKGGDNTYDEDTPAHVAEYGCCTEDGSMALLFARNESATEIAALRASLAEARAEVAYLENRDGLVGKLVAAERARDEAVREGAEYANRLDDWRVKAGDFQRERDEARAEVERLRKEATQDRNKLADSRDEALDERDRQSELRRIAEDAIPRGIEVAKQFLREEYELRMEASVELATCLFNLLNTTTCQDGGGYCSICTCCHSPTAERCWGTRSRNALTKWSNCQ